MRVEAGSPSRPHVLPRAISGTALTKSLSNGTNGTNGTNGDCLNGVSHTNGHSSKPRSSYFGLDSEELTRLMVQTMEGMGYNAAAAALMEESGFQVESPLVSDFREAVLHGEWAQTEALLFGGSTTLHGQTRTFKGLHLAEGIESSAVRFWIRQQKFLELLETGDLATALQVLRSELTPLNYSTGDLHSLSSLMMCDSPEELKEQSGWDGAAGNSRSMLLAKLSNSISSAVMIPENRLSVLLSQYRNAAIENCRYHNTSISPTLLSDHSCDRADFPLTTVLELSKHTDEVWTVRFSPDGSLLASGDKDGTLLIYDGSTFELKLRLDNHVSGVAHLAWSPDSTKIIACCRDQHAKVWDVTTGNLLHFIKDHQKPVSSSSWAADSRSFVTASFDGQMIHWNLSKDRLYTWTGHRFRSCAITPDGRKLIAGTNDRLLIYDFETREEEVDSVTGLEVVSISISRDSLYILLSLNDEADPERQEIQVRFVAQPHMVDRYLGHQEREFVVRSGFGGATETFILAGSEDSNIYLWRRDSSQPMEVLEGHTGCVNDVSWSPQDPSIFASCSDDHTVRIWTKKNLSQTELQLWERRKHNAERSLHWSGHGTSTSADSNTLNGHGVE